MPLQFLGSIKLPFFGISDRSEYAIDTGYFSEKIPFIIVTIHPGHELVIVPGDEPGVSINVISCLKPWYDFLEDGIIL